MGGDYFQMLEAIQNINELTPIAWVERTRGLVKQDDVGREGENRREGDELFLAAGHFENLLVAQVWDADEL